MSRTDSRVQTRDLLAVLFASPCWSLAAADSLQGSLSSLGGGSLLGAFRAADWEPGPKAVVPATVAAKGASFTGDADDIRPTRHEGAASERTEWYLYSILPAQAESAGTTSVQVVRQSSRTLASPTNIRREGSSGGGPPFWSS